jgi:hypothetical protein
MSKTVKEPAKSSVPSDMPEPPSTPPQRLAGQASPTQDNPLLVTPTPGLDMTKSLFPLSPATKR